MKIPTPVEYIKEKEKNRWDRILKEIVASLPDVFQPEQVLEIIEKRCKTKRDAVHVASLYTFLSVANEYRILTGEDAKDFLKKMEETQNREPNEQEKKFIKDIGG